MPPPIWAPYNYLLQMFRSLSWQDRSLETKAAHRSGSFLPSKESNSAATRLRLSSAYLKYKFQLKPNLNEDIQMWWLTQWGRSAQFVTAIECRVRVKVFMSCCTKYQGHTH